MAVREIITYPDARLFQVCKSVTAFQSPSYQDLVTDLKETMYASGGIGLAAPQVGVNACIFICDVSEAQQKLRVFVNPSITNKSGGVISREGCLSIPGVLVDVPRAAYVDIVYQDEYGRHQALGCHGLLAVCIQHELSHLNGELINHVGKVVVDE